MNINLHKKIITNNRQSLNTTYSFIFYGRLMGWTDGEKVIDCNSIKKTIEKTWINGGPNSVAVLMRGIVGPCILEISNDNSVWFFTSCASGGLYWMKLPDIENEKKNFLISNDEGKFLRQALKAGGKLEDGALMNVILSHQSLVRPPFDGLVSGTKRLPPGFYIKFSSKNIETNCYLLNSQNLSREKQDGLIKKKMKAINQVYKSYCEISGASAKIAFSGGVDSTALLLNHKTVLDKSSQGYYKNRGKLPEIKMALEIVKRAESKIDFIKPVENFSPLEIRQKAEKGLSIMNGITYLKHGFAYYPYNFNQRNEVLVLTGQNSDTLFHVDTFAPTSFSTGVIRFIKMTTSMFLRFKTTIPFYKLCRLLKKKNAKHILISNITKTYSSLREHKTSGSDLSSHIFNIIKDYKKKFYILPFTNWLNGEFDSSLRETNLTDDIKDNHATRLARWIRTIGNFHQQFLNFSYNEKIIICTPYSEGPVAFELLSYRLSIKDIFFPKIFLHNYITSEIGTSYSKIRNKVFNDRLIKFPGQIFYFGIKFLNKKLKKFVIFNLRNKNSKKISLSSSNISKDDLSNLREIIGHKDGIVDRILIKYVSDDLCKKHLNFLYDCIELKIDPSNLNDLKGSELCRLVNLQLMLQAEDNF